MKKFTTNHWHIIYGKGLATLLLLLMALTPSGSAQDKDTIFFQYNEEKQILEVVHKSTGDYDSYCIKLNTSTAKEFANAIALTVDPNLYNYWPEYEDQQYLQVYSHTITLNITNWYDSIKIKQLNIYSTNSDILNNYTIDYKGYKLENGRRCLAINKPTIKIEEPNAEQAKGDKEKEKQSAAFPYWIIVVGALVLIGAALFLLRKKIFHKNKNKKRTETTQKADSTLEIVEEVSSHYVCNLDYIRQSPESYFTMDMQKDFADTAVHKIFIHHTAIKKMYDFFKQSLELSSQTNETGCYFIGCWEYDDPEKKSYNISVEDIVEPGDDIVPGEFSFNFGLKIGVKLFARIAELTKTTNRDFVHTVWMHSHPGLGLFLSSHDLLVQKQLTYSDEPLRLAAFVIDTNTPEWDLAVFTAKTNGEMNNKENIKHLYSLESLYRWSRNARATEGEKHHVMTETATANTEMEDYYLWQVNHQGNIKTINAYISGHAINAIDDILYTNAGKQTIGGYLSGKMDTKGNLSHLVIEDCPTKQTNDSFGLLIIDSNIQDSDISNYIGMSNLCCIMVFKKDDEMLVLIRENANQPFPTLSTAARCPMKPMKDWLRRKRIYK